MKNDYLMYLKTYFNATHLNNTTYVETECRYLIEALTKGGLIRYGIKVQSFMIV